MAECKGTKTLNKQTKTEKKKNKQSAQEWKTSGIQEQINRLENTKFDRFSEVNLSNVQTTTTLQDL